MDVERLKEYAASERADIAVEEVVAAAVEADGAYIEANARPTAESWEKLDAAMCALHVALEFMEEEADGQA